MGPPLWPFYLALAVAGSVIGAAVLIALIDVSLHLRWAWRRRCDRRGRGGDLLQELARSRKASRG